MLAYKEAKEMAQAEEAAGSSEALDTFYGQVRPTVFNATTSTPPPEALEKLSNVVKEQCVVADVFLLG